VSDRRLDPPTVTASRDDSTPGHPAPAAPAAEAPHNLPVEDDRYRLGAEHARGGTGRVLEARDLRLERTVAIKVLTREADAHAQARFVREALVTARLQHPGIVPVYDAGQHGDGKPYYAMKLVGGRTLRDAVLAAPDAEARLALLPHVLAIAEAVAYAHSEGVIHRDLKPSNVMVGEFGETLVVDWGLARDLRVAEDADATVAGLYELSHADLTRVGSVVGTPAFMPPEQARGEVVDERADVYALGAILYHLLAARAPFEGASDEVLARVAASPPVPLAEVAPGTPRDLLAIVAKAMARAPADRYPSGRELAADLSRFLTGQVVGARQYGRLTLLGRWLRRHRAPVAVAAVLLSVLAVTGLVSARRIVRERNTAKARSDELILTQASSMLERDPTATLAWLAQYPPDAADWSDARVIAADAASRGVARHVLGGHAEAVSAAVFSPDGARVATASGATVKVWDVESGRVLRTVELEPVAQLAFAPDGRALAAGGMEGKVWLVSLADGTSRLLGEHPDWVSGLEFAPDGRQLASSDRFGHVSLWELASGARRELEGHHAQVETLRFVDDGRALVTVAHDGEARRFDTRSGAGLRLFALGAATPDVASAIAADGTRVVVASAGRVYLWGQGSPGAREIDHHGGPVGSLLLLADGRVVSAGDDTLVHVWAHGGDADVTQAWRGHDRAIASLAASPDGATIASADVGGDIRVWQEGLVQLWRGHTRPVVRLAFSPDGRWLLSASDDGTVRLWPVVHRGRRIPIATSDVFRVAFLAGGSELATTSRHGGVSLVDVADGSVRGLGPGDREAYDLAVLPGDRELVTGSWDGELTRWHEDGSPERIAREPAKIEDVAVSPDGLAVATASSGGDVHLYDVRSHRGQLLHHHDQGAVNVGFSADGRYLASSGEDHLVVVRDLRNGHEQTLRGHEDVVQSVLFTPAAHTLVTGGYDGTVRIWDLDTGDARVLRGHTGRVRALALSPDGAWLASGSSDERILVRDLRGGASREQRGHEAEVRHVAFSPDGKTLASAGWDDTVRLWSLGDDHLTVLRGHDGRVQRVAFSPDGRTLASAGRDGAVILWDVSALLDVPAGAAELKAWLRGATSAVIVEESAGKTVARTP
jgi:WD40 repeat protein